MFVSKWLVILCLWLSIIGVCTLVGLIVNCIVTIYSKREYKEQRLLKIEEDIRYLKGIGGIENE